MKRLSPFNKKGITLIELLVALVISAIAIAGIYRLFISQSRAYTVQDQVVEVQQNIRMAMGILSRDLRMAGFDDNNVNSTVEIANPINLPVGADAISVNYEYYNRTTAQYEKYTVAYRRDATTLPAIPTLKRRLSINDVAGTEEVLLENVNSLNFTYGVDANNDGAMDDKNGNGTIDNGDWVPAASVGNLKVIAIRVVLRTIPDQTNVDVRKAVNPRTLDSAVTLRNLCLR